MCFQFFLLVQYSEFMFCTNSLFLNLGNIFSSCLAVCILIFFWSFVNIYCVHLTESFRTFKIRFIIKCNRDSNMPTALETLRIVYMSSLSIISMAFEAFVMPVKVTGQPDFAASLFDSVPEVTFSTYELSHKIPL